ncbi:uncharacterized protein LOC105207941 [Solenopsis invicta]|uniref:uncharacterized protein LOC105207941 n=1 Tax=Solenopsis invicta TaxID=13686 RepID=UPI000596069E|nr:uncharacterized protein LOC105207941 [Solenopsis invicta]
MFAKHIKIALLLLLYCIFVRCYVLPQDGFTRLNAGSKISEEINAKDAYSQTSQASRLSRSAIRRWLVEFHPDLWVIQDNSKLSKNQSSSDSESEDNFGHPLMSIILSIGFFKRDNKSDNVNQEQSYARSEISHVTGNRQSKEKVDSSFRDFFTLSKEEAFWNKTYRNIKVIYGSLDGEKKEMLGKLFEQIDNLSDILSEHFDQIKQSRIVRSVDNYHQTAENNSTPENVVRSNDSDAKNHIMDFYFKDVINILDNLKSPKVRLYSRNVSLESSDYYTVLQITSSLDHQTVSNRTNYHRMGKHDSSKDVVDSPSENPDKDIVTKIFEDLEKLRLLLNDDLKRNALGNYNNVLKVSRVVRSPGNYRRKVRKSARKNIFHFSLKNSNKDVVTKIFEDLEKFRLLLNADLKRSALNNNNNVPAVSRIARSPESYYQTVGNNRIPGKQNMIYLSRHLIFEVAANVSIHMIPALIFG